MSQHDEIKRIFLLSDEDLISEIIEYYFENIDDGRTFSILMNEVKERLTDRDY